MKKLLSGAALPLGVFALTMSQGAFAVIDVTDIEAAITEGQVAGVAVSLAFGVALWILKGTKLIRPR